MPRRKPSKFEKLEPAPGGGYYNPNKPRVFKGPDIGSPSIIEFTPGLRFMSVRCLSDLLMVPVDHSNSLVRLLGIPYIELTPGKFYFRYELFLLMLAYAGMPGARSLRVSAKDCMIKQSMAESLGLENNRSQPYPDTLSDPKKVAAAVKSIQAGATVLGVTTDRDLCPELIRAYADFVRSFRKVGKRRSGDTKATRSLGSTETDIYRAWGWLSAATDRSDLFSNAHVTRKHPIHGSHGTVLGDRTFVPHDPGPTPGPPVEIDIAGRLRPAGTDQVVLRPRSHSRGPEQRHSGPGGPLRGPSDSHDAARQGSQNDDDPPEGGAATVDPQAGAPEAAGPGSRCEGCPDDPPG